MTAAIEVVAGPTPKVGEGDLARWLAAPTLAAALGELLLLRLAVRVAIHIPGIEAIAGPYGVVAWSGRFAFQAATVLVVTTLVLQYLLLARSGRRSHALAVGATLAAFAGARLGWADHVLLAALVAVSVVVLATGVAAAHRRAGVAAGCFAAAFVAAAVHATAQGLSGSGELRPTSTVGLLVVAEVLLVAAVVALPRAVPPWQRRDLLLGAAVAVLVLGALLASPSTVKVLMLWTVGLPGYLPAAAYALVAGTLAACLRSAWRHERELAIGLGLLVAGGIGLHSTYQAALVVCGLAVLVLPVVADRAPAA